MLYYFLKPLINIHFKVFFKKIYLSGLENIKRHHTVIYAVNHPTAFLDPIVLASYLRPSLHFMLRGDIFTSPLVRWLLDGIKTIPIFRARDGYSALKNNHGTFEIVYQKLKKGENILILAEGSTKHEKKMRPIQKGAARMVFGAYEKYNDLDPIIIPVGVNYTNSDAFRSMIMVDFGPAIEVSKYYETHADNPRRAIKQLTDEISNSMIQRIVHFDANEDEVFGEVLLQIHRHSMHHKVMPPVERANRRLLEKEKQIADRINQMEEAPKMDLKKRVNAYAERLQKAGVKDIGLAQRNRYSWINTLILGIGLIPFCLGYLSNIWPIWLGRVVADAKVEKIEFHSSVRFAVAMLSGFFLLLIILIIAGLNWGWTGVLYALLIPVFGAFSLVYRDFYLVWKEARAVAGLEPGEVEALQKERAMLLKEVVA